MSELVLPKTYHLYVPGLVDPVVAQRAHDNLRNIYSPTPAFASFISVEPAIELGLGGRQNNEDLEKIDRNVSALFTDKGGFDNVTTSFHDGNNPDSEFASYMYDWGYYTRVIVGIGDTLPLKVGGNVVNLHLGDACVVRGIHHATARSEEPYRVASLRYTFHDKALEINV